MNGRMHLDEGHGGKSNIVTDITRGVETRPPLLSPSPSLSMVTIVGVFSLVSSAVVTIHPSASTKTLTHSRRSEGRRTGG